MVRLGYRSSTLRHELLLFAPIVAILAWHFGVAEHYRRPTDLASSVYRWGSLRGKVLGATRNFERYGGRLDLFLRFLYVVSLLLLIRSRAWRDALASCRVVDSLALAVAFFGMYFALPFSYAEATYVDLRALAPATLFLLLACLHLPQVERVEPLPESSARALSLAVVLAFVLSTVNLAYLGKHFIELLSWSKDYRALFAAIPQRSHVLPVYTLPSVYNYVDPTPFMVIDRQALIPFVFSANTGAPMRYFRYVVQPYTPPDDWYMEHQAPGRPVVDWRQIACTYQYILVARPFDFQRISVATNLVAETSSAALLAIDPRACGEPKTSTLQNVLVKDG
jgi:hypothetical protein